MSATHEYLYGFKDDARSAMDVEEKRKALAARMIEQVRKQYAAFAHRHEILVAADVHAEAQPVSLTLYDWTSLQKQPTSPTTEDATSTPSPSSLPSTTEPTTSKTFSVREPGSALAHIKGHFDLGVVRLPDATTSIVDLLVDEARDVEYDFCSDTDTDTNADSETDSGSAKPSGKPPSLPELVRRLRERLASQTNPVGRGRPVQLSSFPVQSNEADNVFGDATKFFLWKWFKLSSPYRKIGSWETSLDDVLENGSWQAGKELTLVLRRVSPEVWQSYLDNRVSLNDDADDNEH